MAKMKAAYGTSKPSATPTLGKVATKGDGAAVPKGTTAAAPVKMTKGAKRGKRGK